MDNEILSKLISEAQSSLDSLSGYLKREENQKKEEPKKVYPDGILSFKYMGTITSYESVKDHYRDYQDWCKDYFDERTSTIHSVKNKHGEIFTIGDVVAESGEHHYPTKIMLFEAHAQEGYFLPCIMAGNDSYKINIDELTKVEKQLLFKTFDNLDCFYGDRLFTVLERDPFNVLDTGTWSCDSRLPEVLYFKDKSNAEKYVAENKKSISYKELVDWVNNNKYAALVFGNTYEKPMIDIKELLLKFKPK